MYTNFFENFNAKVQLTRGEKELMLQHISLKKVGKNQSILRQGDVCRFLAIVEKGALRQYSTDPGGNNHIVQFAVERWTISDLYSFLTDTPSNYNIDAIEDSEIVLIDQNAHEKLLELLPKYETYTRIQLTGAYLALQKRMTSNISQSPEERYCEFAAQHAVFFQRFPQHMIASFLGMRPETLSRIRAKIGK